MVLRQPSQACQLREEEQGTQAGVPVGAHRTGLQGRHQEPEADRSGARHQRGGAIRKRAKRDDWSRDLLERIQDKAEQLVRKDAYAARYARNALRPKLRWWTRMPGCAGCGQDRAGPQARYPARRATASAQCHLPANDFS
jgi:hypothetical protein